MLPLPKEIIAILGAFGPLFSPPLWRHVQVLLIGTVLCRGARTVTAVLRVRGLKDEKRFGKYPRVLNRACGSGWVGARMLLGLRVVLLASGGPILVGIDETVERRKGGQILAQGGYRDAVRSSEKQGVKCLGLKWVSMRLRVPLPGSSRPWAWPFLTLRAPSRAAKGEQAAPHPGGWGRAQGAAAQSWAGAPLGAEGRGPLCLYPLCSGLSTPRRELDSAAAHGRRLG